MNTEYTYKTVFPNWIIPASTMFLFGKPGVKFLESKFREKI